MRTFGNYYIKYQALKGTTTHRMNQAFATIRYFKNLWMLLAVFSYILLCCQQGWVLSAKSAWSLACSSGSAGIWRPCHGSWHHRSSTTPGCPSAWHTRRSGHCQGITCRKRQSSSMIGATRSLERYLRNTKVKVYLSRIYSLYFVSGI